MQSKASTVAEYLASLPADRRAAISAVRDVFRRNLDPVYEEGMHYGMIGYCIPHRHFPAGYHCDPEQPLPFAALASQKNHMSVSLMSLYSDGTDPESKWFREAWKKTGKKLDMGKCCIRFRSLDDLPLEVLGEAIRRMPADRYVGIYMQALASRGKAPARKAPARKVAAKTSRTKRGPTRTRSKQGRRTAR